MPRVPARFKKILETLCRHEVKFIVVGGVSAVLQGAPVATFDLDIVHARTRKNLSKLLAALTALDAFYREQPAKKLRPTLTHLGSAGHQLLLTVAGPLDVLGTIENGAGYDELAPHTVTQKISKSCTIRLLDLETLISTKEKTNRAKDRAVLDVLRETLAQKNPKNGQ